MGIYEALGWIKEKCWGQVLFESDCLVAIQAIRTSFPLFSYFGQIITDCQNLLGSMSNIATCFVYRSANRMAHCVAKASYSFPDQVFSGGCPD